MFGTHDLLFFILAGWLLNITPGPDTALIVARSTQLGLRGGVVAVVGIGCGIMVHVTAAALGISAVIAASAAAFSAMKAPALPLATVFGQGFITNALNPKVALFFLAFLPQFVDAGAPSKALALFFLGVVFNINGTIWNLIVAAVTARAANAVRGARAYQHWIDRGIGAIFVAFGIRLALVQRD